MHGHAAGPAQHALKTLVNALLQRFNATSRRRHLRVQVPVMSHKVQHQDDGE